jgi:hypothetical protein
MKLRILITTAAAALALAAPAQADDASVFTAFKDTVAAERDAANAEYIAAFKEMKRGGATRAEIERLIAANQQINALAKQVHDAVAAQEPSTEAGTKAKKHGLHAYVTIIRTNNLEMKGDQAWLDGKEKRARRYYRRSDAMYRVHLRAWKRALTAFKQAGFEYPREDEA